MAASINPARFLLLTATITIALLLATPTADSPEFFSGERDALLLFLNSLNCPTTLLSNWTGPPCFHNRSRWLGILCSDSHVVGILLDRHELSGFLPTAAFHNLPRLTNLSLRDNSLHGNLPSLRRLPHLQEALFSRNCFSGKIPDELLSLPKLSRLELQENRLDGTVPPFQQRRLVAFNVSDNFLKGGIPRTPVLERFGRSSFDSNAGLCGWPLRKRCRQAAAGTVVPIPAGGVRVPSWSIVLVSIASFLILIAIVLHFTSFNFWIIYSRPFHPADERALFYLDDVDGPLHSGEFNRLPTEKIGNGIRGSTYRVILSPRKAVAVKRLREVDLSAEEFNERVNRLYRLDHKNVGKAIGFYAGEARDRKMVIYEYVDGRSLFHLLHEREESDVKLSGKNRLEIAQGIAQGVYYIHLFAGGATGPYGEEVGGEWAPHGNLKSSNVIISANSMIPKIVNYGFVNLLPPAQVQQLAVGMAPESSTPIPNTDVYCFGLLLVEMVTGIKATRENADELVQWIRSVTEQPGDDWQGKTLDANIADETEGHEAMFDLLEAAVEFTMPLPKDRPDMFMAMRRVEHVIYNW